MYNNYRGGFGGGNMQNLLKQAQKMQEEMQKKQQQLEETVFETSVGGGMVSISMNGKYEVVSVDIKKEVVDPDDVDMLVDLVKSAVNSCTQKIAEAKKDSMPDMAGFGM